MSYRGGEFKVFQRVNAFVESVYGEFSWRVEIGEVSNAADFVRPPEVISKELSGREVNWSLGRYMTRDEVEAIFKQKDLPRASNVFLCQPNPYRGLMWPWTILLIVAAFVTVLVFITGSHRQLLSKRYDLEAVADANGTQVIFSDPLPLQGWNNIRVTASSPVDNSWLYVEGDLFNEETGLVQTFSMPIEYYHGVDGGESWSEGAQESEVHVSALPAGQYTLRLEAQWEKWQQPARLTVKVEQGVPRILHAVLLFSVLSVGPLLVLILKGSFEKRRWSESMFNPYESEE